MEPCKLSTMTVRASDSVSPPVLYNPFSGSSRPAIEVLRALGAPLLLEASPASLAGQIRQLYQSGHRRIGVCGGDGTLALAAQEFIALENTEMAIIPGGTLNHFAKRCGIPLSTEQAWQTAINAPTGRVDVGSVNGQLFLNTSSVGAYVTFVRQREYLEKRMTYTTASAIAGLRRLLRWRQLNLQIDGQPIRSPLVFIGLQEREVRIPSLGQPRVDGGNGLHVFTLQTRGVLDTMSLVLRALLLGTDPLSRVEGVTTTLTESLTLQCRNRQVTIALDGEVAIMNTPLEYRFCAGQLPVVGA